MAKVLTDYKKLKSDDYCIFDDKKREVVFKRCDTPTPWINYLSNGTFTTMISQAGGGVSFYRTPQIWRIGRYKFFHVPTDRSGNYIYIDDGESVWNPTFEPCEDKPDSWSATHGMGYTKFSAEKKGIKAELTYFVGEEDCLIWSLKIKSDKDKKIKVYAYTELGMMEIIRELQWQCYSKHQLKVFYDRKNDALIYDYNLSEQLRPDKTPLVYFTANRKCDAYDGDRDEFVGCYRSETNPYAIEKGGCTNSELMGGDPQFAMQFNLELKAREGQQLNVFLGTYEKGSDLSLILQRMRKDGYVEEQFEKLNNSWDKYLGAFNAEVPDKDAERMINIWNPYQADRNFRFSRNISLYATGTVRGIGFRDTAQDVLAVIPFDTASAREKIKLLLTQQYKDGRTNHYFYPEEGQPPITRTHSDNHIWPIITVYNLINEEGRLDFLDETVSYYDGGEGTVLEHLEKSIEFASSNLGRNGFPLMFHSDWNDMLNKVCRRGQGESIFVSQQLALVCTYMEEIYSLLGKDGSKFREIREKQKSLINGVAWDGKWFKRAVMDDGNFLGSKDCEQAKIWLNTQSWAVMSGVVDEDKCFSAMDSVYERLNTPFGIKKIDPSMENYPSKEDPLTLYNKGCGENGSVFCHANTWAIIAECMLGRGDRAYEYYKQLIPKKTMDKVGAWRYKAEPYAYSSNIFGPESDKPGLANVSWLTGTSSWMYIAITQYVLGIRPVWDGLKIDPILPSEWDCVKVNRKFRGREYNIEITNKGLGNKKITVNGKELIGDVVTSTEQNINIKVEL